LPLILNVNTNIITKQFYAKAVELNGDTNLLFQSKFDKLFSLHAAHRRTSVSVIPKYSH